LDELATSQAIGDILYTMERVVSELADGLPLYSEQPFAAHVRSKLCKSGSYPNMQAGSAWC